MTICLLSLVLSIDIKRIIWVFINMSKKAFEKLFFMAFIWFNEVTILSVLKIIHFVAFKS